MAAKQDDGAGLDLFISHAGPDRAWAEWVAWQLREAGYTVELDLWDWQVGDNFVAKMASAMQRATRVLALVSEAYFDPARYTHEEWTAALVKDERGPRFLPVRIQACDVPDLVKPLLSADLLGLDEHTAQRRLLDAVRGPQRPDGPPVFPPSGQPAPGEGRATAPRLPGGRVPEPWNAPPRNPGFAGRDTVLARLRDRLLAGGVGVGHVLHGMGGIGKTQLVLEYAYRFAGSYDLVWWIEAEQTDLIGTQLADLAVKMGIAADALDVPAAARLLREELRRRERGRWLLVFDNAEDPTALSASLPGGPGHVLITSRNPDWYEIAVPVELDVFTEPESVHLLQNRARGLSATDAKRVAEELGHLPLALAQAAGMLASGLSAEVYLQELVTHTEDLLNQRQPATYDSSLAAAVALSFERLHTQDPAAADLLTLCANFGPEPIPTPLLTDQAVSPLVLHARLEHITHLGLARTTPDSIQVHRLVQAILRDRSTPGQRQADPARIVARLVAASPRDTDDPATWPTWAALLPHLIAAHPETATDPDLRHVATRGLLYLLRRGDTTTAARLAATLHQAWTRDLGPDHPDTLRAATELAHTHNALGHPTDAHALTEDTHTRRRRVLGEDHPDTLRSASDLAVTLHDLGDHQHARDLDQDTHTRRRRILGEDHPDTLYSASNLAGTLRDLGDYQRAHELGQDTLTRSRRVLGEDHPDTLRSASNVAGTLRDLGDHQRAHELGQDTLTRSRRILGEDHPATLAAASNLAGTLNGLGDYQRALELGQDTHTRSRRVLGEDHPATLAAAGNLASALRDLGDHQRARDLAEDTHTRSRRVLGEDHPATLTAAGNLASALRDLGDHQRARDLAEDTHTRSRRVQGEDHPATLRTAVNYAILLLDRGRLVAARPLLADTLARCRKTLGGDHPFTQRAAELLARTVHAMGGRMPSEKGKAKGKKSKKRRRG